MEKMSCAGARQIDLVDYLSSVGFQPAKVRNQDYWYCSPFREEKTASFKVNRTRNLSFDFGEGKGGDIIDFGVRYFKCSVNELLERPSQKTQSIRASFPPPLVAGEKKETVSGKIIILQERPLAAQSLLQYLQKRCIPKEMAEQYCREVDFELYGKRHTAIGFKNDKGGYELRNEAFKGSSSPKASTFYEQGSNQVAVFEGFFDFLSYRVLTDVNPAFKSNFLVLNSLAFFGNAKAVMDKHQTVQFYLDRDKQGMECTRQALEWDNKKYADGNKFLSTGQDLNDWLKQNQSRLSLRLNTRNTEQHRRKGRRL